MRGIVLGVGLALVCGAAAAETACPDKPDALGVSRDMVVSPSEYFLLGRMQYRRTLPLRDREVVLTFDDGPLPPYSDRVLDILASECVKATFFLVGRMARANPAAVRRIYNAGHTIGTHSQNHPLKFNRISGQRAEHEIDDGIASVVAALGDSKALAPYFRIPGLGRTPVVEAHLQSRSLVVWSSDTLADDWRKITANQVLHLALSRLERRGKGVLLLHDIQPRMVLMLPKLLSELKRRGFKIVHVVPEGERPVLIDAPMASAPKLGWPRVASAGGAPLITGSTAIPLDAESLKESAASTSASHGVRAAAAKPRSKTAMPDLHAAQ
jgi:peptidoglycan/xylan/chitin deacetylase (PgdA/CDA1 family)